MKSNKKAIGFGILTNYLQYIFTILLGLVLSPLVLKFAGQETMGAYAILLQVISYVALVDLGIGYSAARFLSQSYATSKEGFVETTNMYRSVTVIQNAVMAILFIVLGVYIQQIFHFSNKLTADMHVALYMLAFWTVISSPWSIYSGILYTTNYMSAQNIIDALSNAVKILLAILFVVLGWSIIGLISAQIISQLLALFAKWYYARLKIGGIQFKFSLKLTDKFKQILSFSFNSFLITVAVKLVFSTDNLVIGYLFGPVAVTLYYLTFQPGNMLNQFILKITDNFTPTINIWHASNEKEKLRTSFLFLFRITFFLTVLMAWGIVLCTEPIIQLWIGKANYLKQPMALWCGIFSASVVMARVPNAFVMADGRIKMLSYFALFEGVLNLSLSFILSKSMGTHAVMLASAIANIPTTIYLYYKAVKILDCKSTFLSEIIQLKYLISILLIPVIWMIASQVFDRYNILVNNNILSSVVKAALSFPPAVFFMFRSLLTVNEKMRLLSVVKIKLPNTNE